MIIAHNLRQLAARRKALGIKPKRINARRLRVGFPSSVEREYRRKLAAYVADLVRLTNEILIPRLPDLVNQYRKITGRPQMQDAWFDDIDDFLESIGLQLSRKWTAAELAAIAERTGRDVDSYVKAGLEQGLERVLGVNLLTSQPWLRDVLEGFSKNNVNLIRTVDTKYLEEIRNLTFLGVSQGLRVEDISKQIQERAGVAESRADLIARDQVGKLVSETNELRQEDLGVTKYIWSTSLDERVRGDPTGLYPKARPSHFDREGKEFFWDEPPEDGHPGQAIQCRCVAIPVMPELYEESSMAGSLIAAGAAAYAAASEKTTTSSETEELPEE